MVIQFADDDMTEEAKVYAGNKTAAKLAAESAIFIIVSQAPAIAALDGDKAKTKVVKKTLIPQNKLESDDLYAAYKAKPGMIVVTDWFGNVSKSYSKAPSASSIASAVKGAKKKATSLAKSLTKDAEKASKAFDKGDKKAALKSAVKVLKKGVSGFEAVETVVSVYESIIEEGREELDTAKTAGDADAIAGLKKLYKGTDLEGEVKAAETELKAKE